MIDYTRIPITLITGFLGSGKTSLLNDMLRSPELCGCAVIINEIGEVSIDHLIVEKIDEELVLLESGCLCCTLRGDLSRGLRSLFVRRLQRQLPALNRVVIETTGLADPAPIIHTLIHDFFLAPRFFLDGVISTADVGYICEQAENYQEALKQIAMADALVLTKCDLATDPELAFVQSVLHALNPAAQCLQAPISDMTMLLNMGLYDAQNKTPNVLHWLNEAAVREQEERIARMGIFGAFGNNAPGIVHDQRVSTHVLRFDEPFEWGDFSAALDLLQQAVGKQILRIKGLVSVKGESTPRVVHGVQHERYPSHNLDVWPDSDHSTRLVFIVNDLPRAVLEKAFAGISSS